MTHILENIICSENDDIDRFLQFYDQQIKEGRLKKTKKYDATRGKIQMLPDERGEAKREKNKIKQKKSGGMDELEKMILAKRDNFGGFLNYMTNKYGGGEEEEVVGKKKRQPKDEEEKPSA